MRTTVGPGRLRGAGLDLAEPEAEGADPCTRFDVTDEPAWEEVARRRAASCEVPGTVSFLAGPESAYCTGAELVVDSWHVLQG